MSQQQDLLGNGKVLKKVLAKGKGGVPPAGSFVSVDYVGKLEDGEIFDESQGYPFRFKLGQGEVINGWDVAVATMTKGEKAVLTIASDYAYGEEGAPPEIPPNATLLFEVELKDFETPKTNPDEERLRQVRERRAAAEAAAKKGGK
ncbi:FK506-binding protein 1A [Balamuthia mandrillaris]